VSLETSGALDVAQVNPKVVKILDLKTPGSKEADKNLFTNLEHLVAQQDQIKFVICNYEDYCWAKTIVQQHSLNTHYEVLFSPSFHDLNSTELAEWILQDKLQVRLQLQLHKILWNDARGK
jgi:7-carboxy-7-deazaguanine synthase